MSAGYVAVQWNENKKRYDLLAIAGIVAYILSFVLLNLAFMPAGRQHSIMIVLIRAFGSCALILLHLVLIIGPLARLNSLFLPLLYNRRHLGVMTCIVACFHAVLIFLFYHSFGKVNPFVSLLTSNVAYTSISAFPFEMFGILSLLILFLLAATSHDFWQKNLGAKTWKSLHMMVYLAYFMVILHVGSGILQSESSPLYVFLMVLGIFSIAGLHLLVAFKERDRDKGVLPTEDWLPVASISDFKPARAKTVCAPGGERIAVYLHEKGFSAVTNLCAHQGGPLGEGKIIDGCITCPWHGWQYRPQDGQSPPPFEEKIATYQTKIVGETVFVSVHAQAPGTALTPAKLL